MLPTRVLPRRDDACDAIGAAALPFTLAAPSDVAIPLSPAAPALSPPGWLGALALLASLAAAALLWQPPIPAPDVWPERPIRIALVFGPAEPAPVATAVEEAPPQPVEPVAVAVAVAVPAPAMAIEHPAPRSPPAPTRPRAVAHPPSAPRPSPSPAAQATGDAALSVEPPVAVRVARPPPHVTAAPRPVAGAAGNPKPIYPPQAAQRGWQGTVLLHVTVSAAGRALAAVVLTSSGHGLLDDQARQTVLNEWRFEPATEDGKAVTGDVNVPIQFRLAS